MPFLSTNQFGAGTLYTFEANDPNAYLLEGVTYYSTGASASAVVMGVANMDFVIAGSIAARNYAIKVEYGVTGATRISVAPRGYVSGDNGAINVFNADTTFIDNSGTIEASNSPAINVNYTAATLIINNSGVIRGLSYYASILAGGGDDQVYNTGTIVGDVSLSNGSDLIDTSAGTIVGRIYGGVGSDTFIIKGTERILESADMNGLADEVRSYGDYALPANVERLVLLGQARIGSGNTSDNVITGTDLGATLNGRGGDDKLYGLDGNDTLIGGAGNDELRGGEGDNLLQGNAGNDTLIVDDGVNTLLGGAGDDRLSSGADADILNGGVGNDSVQYLGNSTAIVGDVAAQTVTGGEAALDTLISIEGFWGSQYADTLKGSSGANYLFGYVGDDKLYGLDGDDRLEGYTGADTIDGGIGIDTAEYRFALAGVTVNLGTGRGSGGDAEGDRLTGIENLTGSNFADTLTGDGNANVLRGGYGIDSLVGGIGTDTLYGDGGDDTLSGGTDADIFAFPDVVAGQEGGRGFDTITAFQNGVDKISFVGATGITSIDSLTIDGNGLDTYIFYGDGDVIRILNFQPGKIDPTDFIFG